jgi:cation-transporting P-type ATPase C
MIFHFDMNQISQKTIVQELENHLLQWLSQNMSGGGFTLRSSKKENPLLKPLLNFLSISFVGISVLLRPLFTKKGLIQTPASMLGLISMVSALPLMKKLVKDIQNRRISSGTILDVSVYASIFAGEILAAIEILWITHAGDLLQAWITERSRRAISSIARVSEKNVIVLKDGHETEITADQLKPQDIVKFYTGDKLAVDGDIIDGFAEIDESSITGRSEPVEKSKGNQIFAGAFVYQGEITVRAQKVGGQTYLA